MKIAWILVLSMVMISCGEMKTKAKTTKKVDQAQAGDDKKAGKTSEQITVCAAYTDLNIDHIQETIVERDGVNYITEVKPAISSSKHGTCHLADFDWVELDSKIYDENMPKPESAEYKEMKAACESLQTDKVIVEFAQNLAKEIQTIKDPQAKGILIAKKFSQLGEAPRVLKCSTDFGVYQPAKIVKAQTQTKK